MKKNVVLFDIHGSPNWKNFLKEDLDNIFIPGDYWDDFTIQYADQKKNFLNLVKYARKDGRIKLCYGNHDLHYLVPDEIYSGKQERYSIDIKLMLEDNIDLFKVGYEQDGFVISHAGFSKVWMDNAGFKSLDDVQKGFDENKNKFLFNKLSRDSYGDCETQGPLWIRPKALFDVTGHNMFFNKQIVGHTLRQHDCIEEIVYEDKLLVITETTKKEEGYYF